MHRRYILLAGASKEQIEQTILEFIGVLGWARAAPLFVQRIGKDVVLAVERGSLDEVKAAFAASPLGIQVLRVSGTLKGLGR